MFLILTRVLHVSVCRTGERLYGMQVLQYKVSRNQQESSTTNVFLVSFSFFFPITLSLVQSLYVLPFHATVSRLEPNSNRRGRKRAGER